MRTTLNAYLVLILIFCEVGFSQSKKQKLISVENFSAAFFKANPGAEKLVDIKISSIDPELVEIWLSNLDYDFSSLKKSPFRILINVSHSGNIKDFSAIANIDLFSLSLWDYQSIDLKPLQKIMPSLHNLSIGSKQLQSLDGIEHFSELQSLYLTTPSLCEISKLNETKVKSLFISSKQTIDISSLPSTISKFEARYCQLKNIEALSNFSLLEINLMAVKIKATHLPPLPHLQKLRLFNSTLSSLENLEKSPLQELEIVQADIKDISPLKQMKTLKSVSLCYTFVNSLNSLSGMQLDTLSLTTNGFNMEELVNQLATIPVSKSLYIGLSENVGISQLDLVRLKQYDKLHLFPAAVCSNGKIKRQIQPGSEKAAK